MIRLAKTYGTFIRLWQGPQSLQIIISDPDCAEKILTSNVHINKASSYDLIEPWLGLGLIQSKGTVLFIKLQLCQELLNMQNSFYKQNVHNYDNELCNYGLMITRNV